MKTWRKISVVLISIILFLLLLTGGLFLTISLSLEYNTLQPNLIAAGYKLINELEIDKEINDNYNLISTYCEYNPQIVLEDYNITIPCEIVSLGPEKIIDFGLSYYINKTYYITYECNFIDCIKNNQPLVLISNYARDFWNSKFKLALIISIPLIILLFISVKRKSTFFITFGSLLITSSLIIKKISLASKMINDEIMANLILVFLTKANNIFVFMITFGLILLITGIIMRLLTNKKTK